MSCVLSRPLFVVLSVAKKCRGSKGTDSLMHSNKSEVEVKRRLLDSTVKPSLRSPSWIVFVSLRRLGESDCLVLVFRVMVRGVRSVDLVGETRDIYRSPVSYTVCGSCVRERSGLSSRR